jgi:hypothetical protein
VLPQITGQSDMPIIPFLRRQSFAPEEAAVMNAAFDAACGGLGLTDQHELQRAAVAGRVIEVAQMGEREMDQLAALVLKELQ